MSLNVLNFLMGHFSVKTECAPEDMLTTQHQDLCLYKLGFRDCISTMYSKHQRTGTESRFTMVRLVSLRRKLKVLLPLVAGSK